jgi:hypothetical protein
MAQARATVNSGGWIFRKVSQTLLEWGNELLDRQLDLKAGFKDWLARAIGGNGHRRVGESPAAGQGAQVASGAALFRRPTQGV